MLAAIFPKFSVYQVKQENEVKVKFSRDGEVQEYKGEDGL